MGKKSSIYKHKFLGEYQSRSHGGVLESATFWAGATVVSMLPPLAFSAITGEFLPLAFMTAVYTVGVLFGVDNFNKSSANAWQPATPGCVPRLPRGTNVIKFKKAA